MATSSITKSFTISDKATYDKLVNDIKAAEAQEAERPLNTTWERGQELLKQFSFR